MAWRRGRAYSQDLRDRVLTAVEDGLSAREAAEQFQVSPSYVIKACQRLHRTGERSARAQCSHTPRKLSEHHHVAIREQVEAQPDATIVELCDWLLREHGVSISRASMWTTLVRLGLTLKKVRRAAEQDRADVAKARADWAEQQSKLDPARLVFLDETPGSSPGAGSGPRRTWRAGSGAVAAANAWSAPCHTGIGRPRPSSRDFAVTGWWRLWCSMAR